MPLSIWTRAGVALGLVAATLAGLATRAEEAPQGPGPAPANTYLGSVSCARCHAEDDLSRVIRFEPGTLGYVRRNEFATWREKDKHSVAFDKLSEPRGKEMARKLGVNVTERASGCLGCHSATPSEINNRDKTGGFYDPKEGVSCENCHGASSHWSTPHSLPAFRSTSTEDRERMGLIDLRLPDRQASQCLSCHVGNQAEGKVVTHAMYAVGHPPLPSIEVATFVESLPRHWDFDADKLASISGFKSTVKTPQAVAAVEQTRKDIEAQAPYRAGNLEKTRLSIVGAAVALRTSMRLVADEAKISGEPPVPGLGWPDYARFDCWSCHHDLKRDGWRQARGFDGPPGRPPLGEWPMVVVELGIEELTRTNPGSGALLAELKGHRKAVRDVVYRHPFGRRDPVAKAAGDFAAWSDVLVKRLATATYDEAAALRLLRRALARAEELTVDHDAARQIAWTVKILIADAGPSIDRTKIDPILKKLDDGLNLKLPAGRDHEIEAILGDFFLKVGDYEPAEFRARIKELAGLIPKE